ncbi:hypothetical protein FZ934_07960 [Rhizobium grahamii]|uniref:Uncharacterized protein n=1 Tax=Rhizobium grahamii TaxID=1120045 RepID=A0A5Q0C4D9_9HYPH|nr:MULTISPECIES: hypothetical protein [Rhizobium]QFY60372.1 hypothetical protein FZ934_07960 [Rhizobium grahamii]QRM50502.1 hypothetical protein F3Y33_14930 [Rhizobium sp. BG6]
MTAINIIVRETDVSIITDSKAGMPANIGHDFNAAKVIPIPHMRVAVATRGKLSALGNVASTIATHAFDYESARAFMAAHYSTLGIDDTEVVVAGWSEEGPAAFIISKANTDGKIEDIERGVLVTPVVEHSVFDAFAADPVGKMIDLVRHQAENNSVVGGFTNVCTIGPDSILTYTADVLDNLGMKPPCAVAA